MKKHSSTLFCFTVLFSIACISWKVDYTKVPKATTKADITANLLFEKYIEDIYQTAHLNESNLDFTIFKKGVTGFFNLKNQKSLSNSASVLTIVNFNLPSNKKRLWIIDLVAKNLVLNTWVSHGQGSGKAKATRFSDKIESHASSLGFYLTDDVYEGKNGRSLRLDGLDPGFNIHARDRAIVIHGAEYVNPNIGNEGYLGRSFGCLAVSSDLLDQVINTLKQKTVIFVAGKSKRYKSKYLDENLAASYIAQNQDLVSLANL
jgi:hypothetical protein